MFNVCASCGAYRADKIIAPDGPFAICPECGYQHPFQYLPLFIVGGASGTGKTTICQAMLEKPRSVVILDADILWCPAFDTPEDNYRSFFEIWLRMAKSIAQSGRPVMLFGAGAGVPENIEPCVERRYFSTVHYMALTCEDDALIARLRARPKWRNAHHESFIQKQITFNHWYRDRDPSLIPPITRLDTSNCTIKETVTGVEAWIEEHLEDGKT